MTDPTLPGDPPPGDDPVTLTGEYALGLLPEDEARALESRMSRDPVLRAELAQWLEEFSAMATDLPPVPPPVTVWKGLEAQLFPDTRQGWLARIGLVPALVAGLVAALLLLAVNQGWFTTAPPGMPLRIAAADDSVVIAAVWDGTDLRLGLQAGAPPEGRVFELWLIAGAADAVSLGVLSPTGETRITPSADLAALMPGATLAITDEPPGGAPEGRATGEIRAIGEVGAG